MAGANGGRIQDEEVQRSSSPSASSFVNEALLLTTMCLVGLPVDVHIRDGSVYSGIFYTAAVDENYAIVLKQARMSKKGSCDSNVPSEGVVETLIIYPEDFVQVVAKNVPHPEDVFVRHETGDDTSAVVWTFPSGETPSVEKNATPSSKSSADQLHINPTRCSSGTANVVANDSKPQLASRSSNALEGDRNQDNRGSNKKEEASNDPPADGRIAGYGSQGGLHTNRVKTENQKEQTVASKDSAAVSSESFVNLSSATPTESIAPKMSNSKTAKEFKLNPGAKVFSPSFPSKRSATPPAVPAGANLAYIPDSYPAVSVGSAQPEVENSPYAPRTLPVKFVQYSNLISGNGGTDAQHSPPIVGYVTNRAQPIRYGGQYHPVQTAPAYVQPGSQNVMLGRLGPVVYVHPVSQDMVQSTTGFSQVSTCSIVTPHQVHVPKHQGSTGAQALQLCTTPPIIAAGGGQPPFVVPSHMPISQPPYHPVIRPISVPGSNGYLVSKFS